MRSPLRVLLLLIMLAFSGLPAALAAPVAVPDKRPPPAAPLVRVPAAQQAIRLTRAVVDGQVQGSLMQATLELTFLNPNARALEGELQFPLRDGQTLTGFALEMADGTLMPAVPVPKARGRQAFDDTIRVRVDPALVEQVAGNRFRLRLYPLNPGKPRRVRLEFSSLLAVDAQHWQGFALPLDFGATAAEQLEVHLRLPAVAPRDLEIGSALAGAASRTEGGQTRVDFIRQDFHTGSADLKAGSLRWRAQDQDVVVTDRSGGQAWFHAELRAPSVQSGRARPGQVTLIWDASGSGAARDHAREFRLLEALFRWQPASRVVLRVVRDAAEPDRSFEVQGGDWHVLRDVLEHLAYDGASNSALWRVAAGAPARVGLALLFSDGLGNWGEAPAPEVGDTPAYAVMAAADANPVFLRQWAEGRGGRLLDLSRLDADAALDSLSHRSPQLLRVDGDGFELLALESQFPEAGHVRFAARFTGSRADANLVWRLPDGSERRQPLTVQAPAPDTEGPPALAARRWAALRVAALEADPELHQGEIEALGQQFGLVTSGTSLLVLENLNDYLRFGVLPPAGPLRAGYLAAQRNQQAEDLRQRHLHLEELAGRFADYQAWWAKDFPQDALPVQISKATLGSQGRDLALANAASTSAPAAQAAQEAQLAHVAPAPMRPESTNAARRGLRADDHALADGAPPAAAPAARMMLNAGTAGAALAAKAERARELTADASAPIDVQLAQWSPDSDSQRRLRDADPQRRYAVYLDARLGAARSPAFFLDAAQVFEESGDHVLAVRILSNLVELDAGNRALLRVLAYRLQQLQQNEEALRQLERVARIAPDEPQSWRDLGLAQATAGHYQRAVDALWRTAAGVWSPRFADVDLIALIELNAIAANHPEVDLAAVDARLRRNLPLDIRVALAWDADNTDVDLWVKDPNGQWTSYQAPLSYQGGHVSRDCTQGYGPEVFSLKSAKPGHYEVRARYYGTRQQTVSGYPTLMLHLTRAFGTRQEQSRDLVVRLEEVKDDLLIGSFDVGTIGPQSRR